ncbi:MAG: hypothetical protein H7831_18300 [Magnetococcus sp. WYHC-3]
MWNSGKQEWHIPPMHIEPEPLVTQINKLFRRDLAAENDFLRTENRVLRELHGDRLPRLNEEQRAALVKDGVPLGDRLRDVISIVTPETLLKWHRRMKQQKWDFSERKHRDARRKPETTEQIVLRLAAENSAWGIERISDELRKLGHAAAPNTVAAMLRRAGFPNAPQRKGMSWKDFIQSHTPQCNAFAERFVREARATLDNLILIGEGQLFRAMKQIEKHHNKHRPNQGLDGNIPIVYDWPIEESPLEDVACYSSLGGLLKHYYVKRAA